MRRDGFRKAYDSYFPYVYAICQRLGVQSRQVEDAVQEVFVVAHRKWASIDKDRSVKAYLAGVALRVSADFRKRAHNRYEDLKEDFEHQTNTSPEIMVQRMQARQRIMTAANELPDEQRDIFLLHDLLEVSVPDIANGKDVTVDTLYSRLRLAREKMAASLQNEKGGQDARAAS